MRGSSVSKTGNRGRDGGRSERGRGQHQRDEPLDQNTPNLRRSKRSGVPPPDPGTGESTPSTLDPAQIVKLCRDLQDDVAELHGVIMTLKSTINSQNEKIVGLEQEIEDLQQYGRRENVCFTNLKFDEKNADISPIKQVVTLCDQVGVDVSDSDFVDVHPLPARKGRAKRVIARFKDRKLAQKVMSSRKNTKNMDPTVKSKLAADTERGFGIQPNITPKRAALLGQCKKVAEDNNFNGAWVDTKTGAVLIRKRSVDRPRTIRSTNDLIALCPAFVPREYFFCICKDEKFDVFDETTVDCDEISQK